MYTLIISLALAALTFALSYAFFGVVAAIFPTVAVLLISFFLISRRLATTLENTMKDLQKDLMKGQIERALTTLQDIKRRFGKWQFFLGATIDGQIGSIYYMKGQFATAKPYLEKAFVRHWVAKAMLAVTYYRERKYEKMNEIFKAATSANKKAGLLWSLWAYCVWRNGDTERAINILGQGKNALSGADPHLLANLLSLQNQKRMKMKSYGEQWYQFQLEVSPTQQMARQGHVRFQNR